MSRHRTLTMSREAYQYPDAVDMLQVRSIDGMPAHAMQVAMEAAGNGHTMSRWYPYASDARSASSSCKECLAYIVATRSSGIAWDVDPGIRLICPATDGGEERRRRLPRRP